MNGETQLLPSPEAFPLGFPIMGESFWRDTELLACVEETTEPTPNRVE